MKTNSLKKLFVALVVFAGFAALNPADARAPRPPSTPQPPVPVSGP